MKKILWIPNHKAGDLVKIVKNTSGHYFEIGETVEIVSLDPKAKPDGEYIARRPGSDKYADSWYVGDDDLEP